MSLFGRGTREGESVSRLVRFFARELGAPPELLWTPGAHVLATPRREAESWWGYRLPMLALSRGDASVVTVADGYLPTAQELISVRAATPEQERLRDLLDRVAADHPGSKQLFGYALYCEPEEFEPRPTPDVAPLRPGDPEWAEQREQFDGPVWVVRAPRGEVAAWSALKLKDARVWEVSVVTREGYRGRGFAKQVASAAASYAIGCGSVPLYVYDERYPASGRVARALGFKEFAREVYCSVAEDNPTGMW